MDLIRYQDVEASDTHFSDFAFELSTRNSSGIKLTARMSGKTG